MSNNNRNYNINNEQVETLILTLKELLVTPPLKNQALPQETTPDNIIKRSKRKSKFTPEQDEMIVDLKKKGKSWVDIAHITGVGSFLAARNRYQVLMGQQGVASTVWGHDDTRILQSLVDEGELEKWRFISREMYKLTGKFFTDIQCRDLVRELFLQDPSDFGVDEETINELANPIQDHQSSTGDSSNSSVVISAATSTPATST